jgi:hypothetical protein
MTSIAALLFLVLLSTQSAGAIKAEDIELFTQLRMLRNQQVHSTNVDRKQVEMAVHMAEKLLSSLS